jgi:hypothetical protein
MSKNLNTTAIANAVSTLCKTADAWDATIATLKTLVASVKSKAELREIILVPVAAYYTCTIEKGQRGGKLVGDSAKTAQKRVERIMKDVLGTPAKSEVAIDFEDAIVNAMQKVLKSLETYADYEVDGKKVGAAKALALLVAEAKDRI